MDFANTCRACMQSDQTLYPLFFDNVSDIFMTCTELKISENDKLPQKICLTCTRHLEASFQFKLQCQMSEASFISYLKDNSNFSVKPLPMAMTEPEPDCDLTDVKLEPDIESEYENSYMDLTNEDRIGSDDDSSNNSLKSDKISKPKEIFIEIPPLGKPTIIECSKCKKEFPYLSALKRHTRSCNLIISCGLCDFQCDTDNELSLHTQSSHAEIKKFDCDICGITFRVKAGLTRHRLRIHDTPPPLPCDHCGKLFKNKHSLHNHTHWIANQKEYKCTICGKILTSKNNLRNHMNIHSGIKPFECEFCNKCFRSRTYLSIHLSRHTGEQPYECVECKKTFTSASLLKEHKMTHSKIISYLQSINR